jgi:hypothetical protein
VLQVTVDGCIHRTLSVELLALWHATLLHVLFAAFQTAVPYSGVID